MRALQWFHLGWDLGVSNPAKDGLHGWKEIAAYLGRDERTAKRWEKQRGLPVRRIPGSGRANVYILLPELEAWLRLDPAPPRVDAVPSRVDAVPPEVDGAVGSEQDRFLPTADPSRLSAPSSLASLNPPASPGMGQNRTSAFLRVAAITLVLLSLSGGGALLVRRYAGEEHAYVPKPHHSYRSSHPEVDQAYLQSVYFFEQRTPDSLREAERNLLEVTARDPLYAPAFAQLANTYLMQREFSSVPGNSSYANAQAAASRAIALDPDLPEAHASLGYMDFFFAGNAVSAHRHFRLAIRLDPACTLAHHWYGSLLTHQGQYGEALDHLNRAQQLQPASSAIQASRAYALGLSGQREEAIRLLQALLKTDPNAPAPHRILARLSLIPPRDLQQFLDETQKFAELRQDAEQLHLVLRARPALRRGGEREMWRSILAGQRGTISYTMAEAEAQLGQTEQALGHLERLHENHDPMLMNLVVDPLLAPLNQDPRFLRIAASAGLRETPEEHDSPPQS